MNLPKERTPFSITALSPGFWWAWLPLFGNWFIMPEHAAYIEVYRLIFYGLFVVSFGLLFRSRHSLKRYRYNRYLFGMGCLLLSGSGLLLACASYGFLTLEWLFIAAGLSGLLSGFVFMYCIGYLRLINENTSSAFVILISMATLAVFFLLLTLATLIDQRICVALVAVMPLVLYMTVPVEKPHAHQDPEEALSTRPDWLPYQFRPYIRVSFVVVGVSFGFAFQSLFSRLPGFEMALACFLGIALLDIFIYRRLRKHEINTFSGFKLPLPFMIPFIMLLPFATASYNWLLIIPLIAAWGCITMYGMDVCVEIVDELNVSHFDAFGQMFFLKSVGTILGMVSLSLMRYLCPQLLVLPALIISFVLAYCTVFVLNDKASLPDWRLRELFLVTPGDSLQEDLTLFAEHHRLTARESDVLQFLAKGRNAQYIARELVITTATAKTHIKRLYAKVGTHSHQELLDMIEQFHQYPSKG
jgi:DNA-binding CsgD family transcriptional regulator